PSPGEPAHSAMKIQILTPLPEILEGFLGTSIVGRAARAGKAVIEVLDLRNWTDDRHRTVDDTPYGGGPGMVMKIEPIDRALRELRGEGSRVVLLSPQGALFDQRAAERLSREQHLILVCGHYEGVDQRVADHLCDEELSIGDFVLTNGALAAAVVADAVVRLLPGVLGDEESARRESFTTGLLDHAHYTRPAEYRGWKVPEVLLSGHHAEIERWRAQDALRRTRERRPDLLSPEA
ncbi:MAG: tRNA (guanosine(37)-N1)-methyltransferase TrmD, partial [Terrimicrobiaceae bacterium]|nr:tRNA (guanosine(37)-N1)-methyltransferase TrmD [Terrimicrobiaceae bacterium]